MASTPTSSNAFLAIFWGGLACGSLTLRRRVSVTGYKIICRRNGSFNRWRPGCSARKRFRAAQDRGAGACSAFLYRIQLGGGLLRCQQADLISDGAAGHRGIVVWRIGLGGDDAGGAAALAVHRWPPRFDPASVITGPIGHTVLVGLPIALAVWKWAPKG